MCLEVGYHTVGRRVSYGCMHECRWISNIAEKANHRTRAKMDRMLESKTQGKQGNKSTEGRTVSSDREATGCSQGGVIGLTLNLGGACMSVLLFFITYILDIVCELFY